MTAKYNNIRPLRPWQYLLQVLNYAIFMLLVWYFSTAPAVQLIDPDEGVITIAFAHAGKLREPCRRLSQEELNELAPNMRKLEDCPRERSPVVIEASLNDRQIYNVSLAPPGLYGDGGVDVYYTTRVPVGEHRLIIEMNDSIRDEDSSHRFDQLVNIESTRILLLGFNNRQGFFINDRDG